MNLETATNIEIRDEIIAALKRGESAGSLAYLCGGDEGTKKKVAKLLNCFQQAMDLMYGMSSVKEEPAKVIEEVVVETDADVVDEVKPEVECPEDEPEIE